MAKPGDKFGMLTLVQLRPTVFRCDCGKMVKGRSVTHVVDGRHKSCGCLLGKASPPKPPTMTVLQVFNPEFKSAYQKVRVRCGACGQEHVVRKHSVGKRRYGCEKCWRENKWRRRMEWVQ